MEKISVVVSCYNEEKALPLFYKEMERVRKQDFENIVDFEYIFVNDGSKDKTLEEIKELRKIDNKVRYVSFSRNFGKEAAMLAGLEASTGDYVTLMDADLQDPPSLLRKMYAAIINEDYVIEGFLRLGELFDCKDEVVRGLDRSKRYCLEILVAFLQEADIIILHEMFENVWNHTIEEVLIEFSLRGAVVVFSEHGEESLMKLPMHSYNLNEIC